MIREPKKFRCWILMFFVLWFAPAITKASLLADPNQNNNKWLNHLTIKWWQWAMSLEDHDPKHPVFDKTGEYCHIQQEGKVWFLAGGFGSNKIRRTCKVPNDKYIFFPIINISYWSTDIHERTNCKSVKHAAQITNYSAINLFASIDGQKIPNLKAYRFSSECFDVFAKRQNKFSAIGGNPAATDGYWILLKPLPIGRHIIKFGGQYTQYGNINMQNIEYEVLVESRDLFVLSQLMHRH